jgi:hypothetical protein
MKFLVLLLFLGNAYGTTIEFIGPCDSRPQFSAGIKYDYDNVGELTIGILEKYNFEYQGTEQSLLQLFDTPVGLDAHEVLSDDEMRSYGWCFKIDGVLPDKYPSDISVTNKMKVITWYYGYADYKKGKWLNFCQEAYKLKPAFLCKTK